MIGLQKKALASTVGGSKSQSLVSRSKLCERNRLQRRHISIQQLDSQKDNRERVVVLGSGWAGYTLSRELNPKKYQVVVVSPR
jgi:hypothetical protein